jgi:short-subunit dehydrogenase
MNNLSQKNSMNIIVSGASRGIGRAVVLHLAKEGHQLLALARNKEALVSLAEQSPNIQIKSIDLLDEKHLKDELSAVLKQWGKVDALLNNAGQLINKPFSETTAAEFLSLYKGNVISALNLSQLCIPYMKEGGHILNISSMGGVQGSSKFPGLSAYSASKGAISILTECMAEELKEQGLSVNALALGAVQTDMLAKAFPGYEAPLSAKEVAEYIAHFLLEGHRFYNGKVLPVSLNTP